MPHAYHVQFGLMRQIGRFMADGTTYERGQAVVVRSRRGTELGTVVSDATDVELASWQSEILRMAAPVDVELGRRGELERHLRFEECRRVFEDGVWPIEPIDLEPLLDDRRAVLHYLGPHRLDVDGLRAALMAACGLDLVFEPAGRDVPLPEPEPEPVVEADHGCGSCGSDGGCGSGSGCGTGSSTHGGCSGCSISTLVSSRRRSTSLA
jgi:hypothetical protein